jgi:hypothetical protein
MPSYYTIQLLNDLHDYFPDLLYADVNRFPTVQSVLEYIRYEARTRHDLYSNARRHHNSIVHQQQPTQPTQQPIQRNQSNDIFRFVFNMNEPTGPFAQNFTQTNEEMSDAENRNPLNDIMRLVQYAMAPAPLTHQNFMEPVIVRPTLQQIAANSTIVEVTGNEACAICQENMASTEPIRRLTRCRHMFHDDCIGTWFTQNVHCPTCRHDIRVA